MKRTLRLNRDIISASLPDIPESFRNNMAQAIARLPQTRREPMKKRLSLGLVLVIALVLLVAGAVAAVLLTPQQVVEEDIIPMAQNNDGVLNNPNFSHEELLQVLDILKEQGITISDAHIAKALENNEGYYEDEVIMAICREAFGGLYAYWTVEQRHWFGEMMCKVNYWEENNNLLPKEGELSTLEAQALVDAYIREHYGAELPLDDPNAYRVIRELIEFEDGNHYVFTYNAADLTRDEFYADITAKGENIQVTVKKALETDTLTFDNIRVMYLDKYGRSDGAWSQETWHAFSEEVKGKEATDDFSRVLLLSEYPLPEAGDMTKEEAIAKASEQMARIDKTLSAVLLSSDDGHVWKVTLKGVQKDAKTTQFVFIELDAKTGETLDLYARATIYDNPTFAMENVLRADYESVYGSLDASITPGAYVRMKLGVDVPTDDETFYKPAQRSYYNDMGAYWLFPKTMEGDTYYVLTVDTEEEAKAYTDGLIASDGSRYMVDVVAVPLTGDTLMQRFWGMHGTWNYPVSWSDEIWHALDEQMDTLDVTTDEAKAIKASSYPLMAEGSITREQAMDIAARAYGKKNGSINGTVYLGAEPNNVWKVWMLSGGAGPSTLYEIDSVTGEVLYTQAYDSASGYEPGCKAYTLHTVYEQYITEIIPDEDEGNG